MTSTRIRPSALHKYAEQIRSWINHPQRAKKLRRQTGRWNQICSSLDSLQQTELAMQAYISGESVAGSGENYLVLYGLLQAMVLQQDAVCHLDEALGGRGTAIGDDLHFQEIRKIRNVSVGHPTKVDRRDVMSHHQISRPKLGQGFELVSAYDDGRRQFTFVSVAQLIRKQKISVARMLRVIVKGLDQELLTKTIRLKRKSELVREHAMQRTRRPRKSAPMPVKVATPKPVARLAMTTSRPVEVNRRSPHHRRPRHERPVQSVKDSRTTQQQTARAVAILQKSASSKKAVIASPSKPVKKPVLQMNRLISIQKPAVAPRTTSGMSFSPRVRIAS